MKLKKPVTNKTVKTQLSCPHIQQEIPAHKGNEVMPLNKANK